MARGRKKRRRRNKQQNMSAAQRENRTKGRTIPESLLAGVLTPDGEIVRGKDAFAFIQKHPQRADAEVESWQTETQPGDCFVKIKGTLLLCGEIVDTFDPDELRNFRLARCYSLVIPEGELLGIHVADIPQAITRREFEGARRAHWRGYLHEPFADAINEEFGISEVTAIGILSDAARMSECTAAIYTAPPSTEVIAQSLGLMYGAPTDTVAALLNAITSHTCAYADLREDAQYVVQHGQEGKRWNYISVNRLHDAAHAIAAIHAAENGDAVPEVYILDVARGKAMTVTCVSDLARDLWGPLGVFGISRFEMRTTLPQKLYGRLPENAVWD